MERYAPYSKKVSMFLIGIPLLCLIVSIYAHTTEAIVFASIIFYVVMGNIAYRKMARGTDQHFMKEFNAPAPEEACIYPVALAIFWPIVLPVDLCRDFFKSRKQKTKKV